MNILKDKSFEPFLWFLYSAVLGTALFMTIYICVQQSFRQNLNDPQITIAEDAARALKNGAVPAAVVLRGVSIDLRNSLSPWITVYDASRTPLESSGVLDGAPPVPPPGTFDESTWLERKFFTTDVGNEVRFTWEPRPDVRQAVVLIKLANPSGSAAYVAVGRNMREIEGRIVDVGAKIFIAWFVTGGALFVLSLLLGFLRRQ